MLQTAVQTHYTISRNCGSHFCRKYILVAEPRVELGARAYEARCVPDTLRSVRITRSTPQYKTTG